MLNLIAMVDQVFSRSLPLTSREFLLEEKQRVHEAIGLAFLRGENIHVLQQVEDLIDELLR